MGFAKLLDTTFRWAQCTGKVVQSQSGELGAPIRLRDLMDTKFGDFQATGFGQVVHIHLSEDRVITYT